MISPYITPPDKPVISIAVGIIVGLVASFVQSLGLTMQRKSHLDNEALPEEQRRVEHRRPLWLLGFLIFISSNILGSIFQIASLPVVILAPLGAVSLLWNAVFARLMLGDVFSHFMVIGTLFIAGGAVMIAIFGIVPEPTHSLDDLLRLFARKTFIIYFSLLGAALLVVLILSHIFETRLPDEILDTPMVDTFHDDPSEEAPRPSENTPLLRDNKSQASLLRDANLARKRTILAVSFASSSGILSGMCLLFAKSGVELLVLTVTGDNQFWRWQSWALVGGLVAFAVLQLIYLHKSLVLADPTLVCPLAFCFYNLSSILNGLVYYNQFGALTTLHLLLVLLGITILLAGVWAVSIQPGGNRRVEVGTWQEGAEILTTEAVGAPSIITTVEPPSSPVLQRQETRATIRRRGMLTDEPTSEVHEEMLSPTENVSPHQFPSLARSPTRGPYGHFRGPKRKWSTILDTQAGTTSGFSIGLSPASPGFALIPRRRVSGSTLTIDTLGGGRRSVSENDMGRRTSLLSQNESEGGSSIPAPVTQSKKRWNWIRRVFNIR